MKCITESQLVLPALYILSKSVSKLITQLTEIMHPTGIYAEILSGRSDTHFSQKVRNLKSHDTLQKQGYADNYGDASQMFVDYPDTMIAYVLDEGYRPQEILERRLQRFASKQDEGEFIEE